MIKFETTFLFDENFDETNNIRNVKIITFVTLKSLLSNGTQIEKSNYFLTNLMRINVLNKE